MYVPIPVSDSNATSKIMDEKLNATKTDLTNALDSKLSDARKEASKDFDAKLEDVRSKSAQDIDHKLVEGSNKIADRVAKSESSVQNKLNELQNESKQHLSEASKQSSERLDRISQQLSELSNLTRNLVESSKNLCRTGDNEHLTLSEHHARFESERDRLLEAIRASVNESVGKLKSDNEHEQKVRKDEDIKRNIDVRIEAADDENPAIGKLLPLTPIVTARKLRQIWNAQMGKGMVSVCYHNQPRPMAADHPLVENDDPMIQSIFNGTMDSAHNLQAGLNLDTPAYINSLLMEVRSLDRQFVSLCLEDPQHDVEFYHKSSCMNLVVTRK